MRSICGTRTSSARTWSGRASGTRTWRGRTSATCTWRGRSSTARTWRRRTSATRTWRRRTSSTRTWRERPWRGRSFAARTWRGRWLTNVPSGLRSSTGARPASPLLGRTPQPTGHSGVIRAPADGAVMVAVVWPLANCWMVALVVVVVAVGGRATTTYMARSRSRSLWSGRPRSLRGSLWWRPVAYVRSGRSVWSAVGGTVGLLPGDLVDLLRLLGLLPSMGEIASPQEPRRATLQAGDQITCLLPAAGRLHKPMLVLLSLLGRKVQQPRLVARCGVDHAGESGEFGAQIVLTHASPVYGCGGVGGEPLAAVSPCHCGELVGLVLGGAVGGRHVQGLPLRVVVADGGLGADHAVEGGLADPAAA